MNKRQSNKYNSYINLKGVLQANANLYASIPILQRYTDRFLELLDELISLNSEQAQDTTSVTSAKAIAKEKMARMAAELASAAMAWASEQNNPQIMGIFDYSYSDICFTRDNEASSITMSILEGLKDNAEALTEFMVSNEDISALESLVTEFASLSESKGAIKSTSVSETRRLSGIIAAIDELLNAKLDKLLKRLESSQPSFYIAYNNARSIIDL